MFIYCTRKDASEKIMRLFLFFIYIKMSCYRKNREALLEKAHDKYHNGGAKGKAAKYYKENRRNQKKRKKNVQRNG